MKKNFQVLSLVKDYAIMTASTCCLIVLVTVGLSSCKKDTNIPAPVPQEATPQIASTRQTVSDNQSTDYVRDFVYDEQGRVTEIKRTVSGISSTVEKYIYGANVALYRLHYLGVVVPAFSIDYTLDNNGKAEKAVHTGSVESSLNEYNSSGYLSRSNQLVSGMGNGYSIYHYNSNNVLDSISGFFPDGKKRTVDVLTYESGRKNTIGNANKGLSWMGKDQAAPVKRITRNYYDHPGMYGSPVKYYELDYAYVYDDKGFIKKHTLVKTEYNYPGGASSPIIKEIMEYTYKQ